MTAVTQARVGASASPAPKKTDELYVDDRPGPRYALYLIAGAPWVVVPILLVVLPVYGLVTWLNSALFVGMYFISTLGVTAGYHRLFTHLSYKVPAAVESIIAIAGSFGIQGGVIQWVADHRWHHKYSDSQDDLHSPWNEYDKIEDKGDPDNPWRFGKTRRALIKGMWYAHYGWLMRHRHAETARFAPDLMAKPHLRIIEKYFLACVIVSLALPAGIDYAVTGSLTQAIATFWWAGVVRMWFVHHVTWSTNSVCHVFGTRPDKSRKADRSTNFWPLALLSLGENWHNSHHANPSCARHGMRRGQIDVTARFIWILERLHIARQVNWPKPQYRLGVDSVK